MSPRLGFPSASYADSMQPEVTARAIRLIDWLWAILAAGLLTLFFFSSPTVIFVNDSHEYVDMAEAAANGSFLTEALNPDHSFAFTLRMPLYPLLLAAGAKLCGSMTKGVLLVHALVFFLTQVPLMLGLRRYCHPLLTAVSTFAALYPFRIYANILLTEWICVCLLLLLVAVLIWVIRTENRWGFIVPALLISALTLVRPAMIVTIVLLPACVWMASRKNKKRIALSLGAGFVPIFLWLGFNFYRFHQLTLCPIGGYALFAATSAILPSPPSDSDSPLDREFADAFKRVKRPPGETYLPIEEVYSPNTNFESFYGHNLAYLISGMSEEIHVDFVGLNKLASRYATRAISKSPWQYLRYWWAGFRCITMSSPAVLAALVLPIAWLRKRRHPALACTCLSFFVFHVIHVANAAAGIMTDRFIFTSGQPAAFCGFISVLVLCSDLLRRPSFENQF